MTRCSPLCPMKPEDTTTSGISITFKIYIKKSVEENLKRMPLGVAFLPYFLVVFSNIAFFNREQIF